MEKEFKYRIWNLPEYIRKLESTQEKLVENVTGGAIGKKLTASTLAGLSILSTIPSLTKPNVNSMQPDTLQNVEVKKSEITKEQAIQDINYVLKVIKDNHISAFEKIPDEVVKQAETEIKNLGSEVSIINEWRIISRIISKLHDAHTVCFTPELLYEVLDIDTKYENGKFICTNGEFNGCEITAINDIPISELYEIYKNHFSYENEQWAEYNFFEDPSDYIPEEKLALCGINTFRPLKLSFKTKSGIQSKEFGVKCLDEKTKEKLLQSRENWISYEIDEKNSVGIFKLDRCVKNEKFAYTMITFFKKISENKIKNLVIDLRKNHGGTFEITDILFFLLLKNTDGCKGQSVKFRVDDKIEYCPSLYSESNDSNTSDLFPQFDGNVFILTSHGTFSAAVDIATIFSDNKKAKIVGEIPGGSPTTFGVNTPDFKLPNGNLVFGTTSGKYYRPDETKDGKELIPDVQVPAKDALDKVYELIKNNN